MFRKRWFWWTLVILLLLAAGPAYYFIARAREFARNEKLLAEAIADTDRLDPKWRWDDVMAAREPVPEEKNAARPIRKVKALLGEARLDTLRDSDGIAYGNIFWDFAPNQMLREMDRPILDKVLAPHGEAVEVARSLVSFGRARYEI